MDYMTEETGAVLLLFATKIIQLFLQQCRQQYHLETQAGEVVSCHFDYGLCGLVLGQ